MHEAERLAVAVDRDRVRNQSVSFAVVDAYSTADTGPANVVSSVIGALV